MARRPAPSRTSRSSSSAALELHRFPDLPAFVGIHDETTCPTCAPIVTSPPWLRGVAAARADHHHQEHP